MFDFNGLYRSVFRLTADQFAPDRNYYTVLIDFSDTDEPFEGYYKQLSESLNLHIHDDALSEVHIAKSEVATALKNRLQDIKFMVDENVYNTYKIDTPRFNYVVVTHIDNADTDISYIKNTFDTISRMQSPSDNTVFIFSMPDEMVGVKSLLERVMPVVPENTNSYVFTAFKNSVFRRQALIDSAVGAIIMNAFVSEVVDHDRRKKNNENKIEAYLRGLDAEGVSFYTSLPPINWSTIYCKYFDKKRDFLLWYSVQLGRNVRELTLEDCRAIMYSCYEAAVPTRRDGTEKNLLKRTMAMIPGVNKPKKSRGSSESLSGYFNRLYNDSDGIKKVELSLKATMSMLGNDPVDDAVMVTARRLLEECAEFNTNTLKTSVIDYVKHILTSINDELVKQRSCIKDILENETYEDGEMEDAFDNYASNYLKLYDISRKISFWNDVVNCIRDNDATFNEIYAGATERYNDVKGMENLLKTVGDGVKYNVKKISSYKPRELLNAKNNEEICREIAENFDANAEDNQDVRAPRDVSPIFDIGFVPNIYSDFPITFANAAYLIVGVERNGKYLIYLNGEDTNV